MVFPHHSHDGSIHGQLRMPRRTQDGVESEETVRDDVTQQNNFHVLPGVGECGGAGTEKAQNRIEKDQRHNAEQDTLKSGSGVTTLPKMSCAALQSCCPNRTDIKVDAPIPTMAPNAADKFMKGNVSARPEMAKGPTP